MKNIYMSQPNRCVGRNIYFPYASGALIAYAQRDCTILKSYDFKEIFFAFEDIDTRISKMEDPFLVGFSCYIWNYEYNLKFAQKLKEKYPKCYVLFGGHNVPSASSDLLKKYAFIDFLIHDEGEVPFQKLLLALNGDLNFSEVPNLSYREGNQMIKTESHYFDVADFPSPYITGVFDEMVQDERYIFSGIFETNRGCPFGCAYCDWGLFKSKIRQFPMERVLAEIDWLSEHQIDYSVCADANFGILDRDMEITDYLTQIKTKTGFPNKICFCYTKNCNETVFEINRKLHRVGILKSATLAIQTLHEKALKNVGRSNLSFEKYNQLNLCYRKENIPVLTELILGLPGETYESFRDGLCHFPEIGHHIPINVYSCELLMNSRMAQSDYIRDHKIQAVRMPLVGTFHSSVEQEQAFPEYSNIVVETESMTTDDWIRANLFQVLFYSFHGMGLLQFFAQYLFYEKNISYASFYEDVMVYVLAGKGGIASETMQTIREGYEKMLRGQGYNGCVIPWIGDIIWPFNEVLYIECLHHLEQFYDSMLPFLERYSIPELQLDELTAYQKAMIKHPAHSTFSIDFRFDWHQYYLRIFTNSYAPLAQIENTLHVSYENMPAEWMDFVREMVWYGRRDRKNLCVNDVSQQYL